MMDWNPQGLAVNALSSPVPMPTLLNTDKFTQNYGQGMTDQTAYNALAGQRAAGQALARGDVTAAKAAAFGSGNTQLGMTLTDSQNAQQQRAFQLLGGVAASLGATPDGPRWARVLQSIRSTGMNVPPELDDPVSGPKMAVGLAGLAPQMQAMQMQRQQMGLEQARFGMEQNQFQFQRQQWQYGNDAINQLANGGGNALASPQGSPQAGADPTGAYPSAAPAMGATGQGNALAPPSGLIGSQPPMAASPPQVSPAPPQPQTSLAPGFVPRAYGNDAPTPAAATGLDGLSPQTIQAIKLERALRGPNASITRILASDPYRVAQEANAKAGGANAAELQQKAQTADRMRQIADGLENELDTRFKSDPTGLQMALGPQNIDHEGHPSTFLADRANSLNYLGVGPGLNAIADRLQGASNSPSYRTAFGHYNSLLHMSDMIPAVFRGGQGTDQAQGFIKDLIGKVVTAPNYKESKDIIKKFRQTFLPSYGGGEPGSYDFQKPTPDKPPAAGAPGPAPASPTDPLGLF